MKGKFWVSIFGWSALMFAGQFFGAFYAIIRLAFVDPNFSETIMSEDTSALVEILLDPMLIFGMLFVIVGVLIRTAMIKNETKTFGEKFCDYINLHKLPSILDYFKYFCLGVLINVVLSFLLNGLYSFFEIEDTESVIQATSMLTVFCIAFLVPFGEEVLYRNRIDTAFKNITANRKISNMAQSLMFGLAHGNPIQIAYTFCFGMLFGHINDKHNSIWPSICIHCGINFYAAISLYAPDYINYVGVLGVFAIPMIFLWIARKEIK